MNRRELYRPLTERTLEHCQVNYLARKYDFGKESRVAHLIVSEINSHMDKAEKALGIKRVKPFELFFRQGRKEVILPLFKPEYLEPLYRGENFASSKCMALSECRRRYFKAFQRADEKDFMALIDPWSLVMRRQEDRFIHEIFTHTAPCDENDPVRAMLNDIKPIMPVNRLDTIDTSAPASVVKELVEFVIREGGLGRRVSRELVEEIITLRSVCCPRTRILHNGEMPMILTHVNAHLTDETRTKFRRLAPVYIQVLLDEEIENLPYDMHNFIELFKSRIARVCFQAYRQNGLLTQMELQWVFQVNSSRISEMIRNFQKEHKIIIPTPGTILDSGRSMTHKDIIINLHLQGFDTKEIARMAYHSPRSVDSYIKTFESVLILDLFGIKPDMMARLLAKGISLIREHLNLITEFYQDRSEINNYLIAKGVNI